MSTLETMDPATPANSPSKAGPNGAVLRVPGRARLAPSTLATLLKAQAARQVGAVEREHGSPDVGAEDSAPSVGPPSPAIPTGLPPSGQAWTTSTSSDGSGSAAAGDLTSPTGSNGRRIGRAKPQTRCGRACTAFFFFFFFLGPDLASSSTLHCVAASDDGMEGAGFSLPNFFSAPKDYFRVSTGTRPLVGIRQQNSQVLCLTSDGVVYVHSQDTGATPPPSFHVWLRCGVLRDRDDHPRIFGA